MGFDAVTKTDSSHSDFSRAAALHQQGRLDEAIVAYREALRKQPNNTGGLNLLGIALSQAGRPDEAVLAIRGALDLNPDQPSAHYNLGTILQTLSRPEEALDHFQRALALKSGDPEAHNNIGAVLKGLGRIAEAADAYRKAVALQPGYAEASVNLAAALISLKRYDEGKRYAEKALMLNPNLAEAHVVIGNALREEGKMEDAMRSFDRAIAVQPGRTEAYVSAGNTLIAAGLDERAVPYFEKASALLPESACTYLKLANSLFAARRQQEAEAAGEKGLSLRILSFDDEVAAAIYFQNLNRHDLSLPHYEKALALDPDSESMHRGYSHSLQAVGRQEEALHHIERALELDPEQMRSHYNRALLLLGLGKFVEGWRAYEARFADELRYAVRYAHSAPRWNGKNIAGKLAVWGEQGIGDQILYASIVPDLLPRAKSLVLEVEPRLIPLFARSFPDAEIRSMEEAPDQVAVDAHIPIGGIGEFFRKDWSDFPQRTFLKADSPRAARLRDLVHQTGKATVGISWRSANIEVGTHKTAKLSDFSVLLTRSDLSFVDLQYGDTAAEIASARREQNAVVRHLDEIDNTKDIDGLAALIEACDLVVTVSNTTAHIAGALGKPVWILIPHGAGRHWYWFKDRMDSPWYPGARIVRQRLGQSWADVVASIAPEISGFVAQAKK